MKCDKFYVLSNNTICNEAPSRGSGVYILATLYFNVMNKDGTSSWGCFDVDSKHSVLGKSVSKESLLKTLQSCNFVIGEKEKEMLKYIAKSEYEQTIANIDKR